MTGSILGIMQLPALILAMLSCLLLAAPSDAGDFAFIHVNVVPMDRETVLRDYTVLVSNGVVIKLGPAGKVPIPNSSRRIEGHGKYLIPGLADMHVHLGAEVPGMGFTAPNALDASIAPPEWDPEVEAEFWLYLVNGVTTVRNMSGSPTTLHWRRRIESGEIAGPRIHTASPIIDGDPPSYPSSTAIRLSQVDRVHGLVDRLQRDGYEFVKVYNTLTPEVYFALADATHAAGLLLVGHVPYQVGIEGALKARQDSIEHLRGYDFGPNEHYTTSVSVTRFTGWLRVPDEKIALYARETAATGTWNCPTLVISQDGTLSGDEQLARRNRKEMQLLPRRLREVSTRNVASDEILAAIHSTVSKQRSMVKALQNAGARLLAGTDSPLQMVVPGFDLHRELELLVEAGLTPFQALLTATKNAQEFLRCGEHRGTIAIGQDADLVMIEGNPLLDAQSSRHVAGVLLRDNWYSREKLQAQVQRSGAL
jgi:imidazolonepropionase-like amidohydrolase